MDDNSILTQKGDHKGKKLSEIPDSWFLFMYDKCKLTGELKKYAIERIPMIRLMEEKHLSGCRFTSF
jgi:hypothetical protein